MTSLPAAPRRAALFLLLLFVGSSSAARAQNKLLTLDELYDPVKRVNFSGSLPQGLRWTNNGTHYLQAVPLSQSCGAELRIVDARTGRSAPFFDATKMERALAQAGVSAGEARALARRPGYELDAAQTQTLLAHNNDLFVYTFASGTARRLTRTPAETENNAAFSPDGRRVAFVKNNDLYVVETSGAQTEKRLTNDGGPLILNGRLDWVYEEEVYGRGNSSGFRWSPDGKRVAFLRLDERPVKVFVIVDHLPRLQTTEQEFYPKAGDPNPIATLAVANVSTGKTHQVDVAKYPDADRLIVRFNWTPGGEVAFQVQNREQTWLDLNVANAETGKAKTLLRETSKAWVDVVDEAHYLADGSFLWQSDRTGFRHLYRYRPDGVLVGAVTRGEWDVRDLHGVDEKRGVVYFSASAHSPLATHAFRVNLDGTHFARLTTEPAGGSHSVRFDPTFSLFLDTWSDVSTPPQLRVRVAQTGQLVRVVAANPSSALAGYRLSRPEFVSLPARDGFALEALILRPPDFDPAKKYPVYCPVYGGPGAQSVRDSWGGSTYLWHQLLAQKGIVVFVCDNRSASGKGARSAYTVYKNFGAGELRDLEDGLDWLQKQPGIDARRVGIGGWSFGGFFAQYALTHSARFRVGIAGAGVSDWRLYDTIYTERYLGTPQSNPGGYQNSAPVQSAAQLSGKLLLLHGTLDDNVHLQNTLQLSYALQRANKDFELMLYPRSRHGVGDPLQNRHLRTLMTQFLLDNL